MATSSSTNPPQTDINAQDPTSLLLPIGPGGVLVNLETADFHLSSLHHRAKNGLVETWAQVGIGSTAVGSTPTRSLGTIRRMTNIPTRDGMTFTMEAFPFGKLVIVGNMLSMNRNNGLWHNNSVLPWILILGV